LINRSVSLDQAYSRGTIAVLPFNLDGLAYIPFIFIDGFIPKTGRKRYQAICFKMEGLLLEADAQVEANSPRPILT
jgi:hypothetical protein